VNAKTSIAASLSILAILFVGIAILTHQPDTIVVITIPSWLRAGGAVGVLSVVIFWLHANLWHLDAAMNAAAAWLAADESQVR